jgi:hypothetical protein
VAFSQEELDQALISSKNFRRAVIRLLSYLAPLYQILISILLYQKQHHVHQASYLPECHQVGNNTLTIVTISFQDSTSLIRLHFLQAFLYKYI